MFLFLKSKRRNLFLCSFVKKKANIPVLFPAPLQKTSFSFLFQKSFSTFVADICQYHFKNRKHQENHEKGD